MTSSFSTDWKVEKLVVSPITEAEIGAGSIEFGESLGAMIALAVWFGFNDLHTENMIIGKLYGRLVIAPVDLECAFMRIFDPTDSMLIPSKRLNQKESGFGFLFEFEKKMSNLVPILYGYLMGLGYLETLVKDFAAILMKEDGPLYSRLIYRSTRSYQKIIEESCYDNEKLFPEEKVQLKRRDIPYFFRDVRNNEILYFSDPVTMKKVESDLLVGELIKNQRVLDGAMGLRGDDVLRALQVGLPSILLSLTRKWKREEQTIEHKGLTVNVKGEYTDIRYKGYHIRLNFDF